MTLPQAVDRCLQERKYNVLLQNEPVDQIEVSSEYHPREGMKKPLVTIEYDSGTGIVNINYVHKADRVLSSLRYPALLDFKFPFFGHLSVIDRRIITYVKKRAAEIGRKGGPQNFYEAFVEFQKASGRF